MKKFYFLLLAVLAGTAIYAQVGKQATAALSSVNRASVITPIPGSGRRACSPIPTKDGIAINPQVKVLPNKDFIKVSRQGYTGSSNFTAAGCNDLIVDGSFENGGIPSTTWPIQTSTNFGTPLCDNASCGTGGGASPPRTGLIWAWFGGFGGAETATLGQTVTILPGNATLTYWMRIGTVNAPFTDVFTVKVDGTVVQTFTEPAVAEAAYTQRTVNLNAYANGAAHSIVFSYVGTTTGIASFVVDDVQLINCNASNADLSITKTDGVTTYNPGGSTTYTIVASNAGIDAITGATVTDNFPAAITSAAWTAAYAGGASGPASGAGNINATVNLPVGGTATFTAVCTISAAATGSLSNTATIASPTLGVDPVPGNNSATDTDTQGAALTCGWTASTVYPIPVMDEPVVTVGTNMYTFSGVTNAALVATSYKFDGTTWSTIAALPVAVEFASAVTDGTNIYIMGGVNGAGNAVKTLRRYNVATNTYTNLAAFNTNVWGATAAYLNGKIYKFSGNTNTGVTNVLEIYDIATNTWTAGAAYPLSLGFVNCFVSGNFIYAAGGIDAAATPNPSLKTYRYDPATNTWNDAAIADLPATRWGGASALYNGQGLIAGGFVGGANDVNISTSAIVWDPTANAWSTIPSMLAERARMGGAVLNNSFYVVGGASIAEALTFIGTNNNQKYSVARATISYPASPYCSSAGTIPVTQTGTTGGTYSSTAGLSINATTGDINAGTSTAGTYTVTYTIAAAGPCPGFVTTASVTITAAPSATISYAGSPYCSNAGTANVTQTGTAGGTYTSTAGLVISSSTGAVTLGTSTAGTYTVTYTVAAAGGCAAFTTTASITITAPPSATINYPGSPYCQSAGTATVTQTGTAGGVYSSTAGLVISSSTGTVTLGTSTPGTYTVSYTLAAAGGCAAVTATASISITATPNATISYPGSPYCPGAGTANVTQTGTTGGTYSSTAGLVINAATGAVTLGTSTPGTYTVTYTIAAGGGCASFSTTASITISNTTTATISYAGSPYCSNAGTATVTQTGTSGGTYTSTAGLIINAATGAVTLATSTPGTYTVTYTIAAAGGCSAFTTTTSITITAAASATINYTGSPYCQSAGTATVTQTGTGGGTYSSTAGLIINAATGAITLGTSTPGVYTVTYTIAAGGGCAAVTATAPVTITATPNATISYAGSPYCQSGGTATVTQTGTAGGTYSSTAGLTISASTGTVTLGTSTLGTYTVTYTIAAAGGCAAFTTTASITIGAAPTATISYAGSPYCQSAGTASVTQTGTAGGAYSSTAGLVINAATGAVTLGTSTPGTYTVTYTIAAAGGCATFTTTASITITATPNATISYAGSPYCQSAGTANVTQTGTAGGTYSSTAGLVINAATGAVTLGTSTAGTYTVTYTVAAAGGCAAFTTTASITITATPNATISYAGSPYCQSAGTATVTQTGTAGGTYSSTAGLIISASTGTVTLGTSTPGTYTVTYTVAAAGGCAAFTTTASITITATPNATINYPGSPYCAGTGTAAVTQTGTAGGVYSSTAGLVINAATGAVTLGTSTAGTYTVTYTVAAAGGCAAFTTTASISIGSLSTAPTGATANPAALCAPATVTLTAVGGTPGAGGVYKWYAGSCGGTPVGTGVTITTTISATTTFYVRIETPCDMTTCASVTVNVYPQPVVVLSVASGLPAPGQTNPGHPSGLYTTISPAGNYTYVWTLNGSVISANGPTITPANGLFTDFGTYAVTATNTATGCSASSNAVTVTDIAGDRGHLFITPNPAHSNIDIHYYSSTTGTQARTVSLFTATGQRLMNVAYTPSGTYGNMTLDISMLPPGTYIVVLLDGANKKIASAGLVKL